MTHALAHDLIQIASDEYQVDKKELLKQMLTGHDAMCEQICESLRLKAWQITWYKLCHPSMEDDYVDEWRSLSFGFVIADHCDQLIAWRLKHAT